MKIIFSIMFLLLLVKTFTQVSTYILDQNNVSAKLMDQGVLFYDPNVGATYEVPKNTNVHAIYSASFWFSALDENSQIRVAGALYEENGKDYFSGPFSNNDSYLNSDYVSKYTNAIWVVTQAEIANHIQNYTNSSYVTPPSILNWPGNGDVSLGVSSVLAPFIDVDGDGNYNPSNGDYPCIKGDKAAYIIMNDAAGVHGKTGGQSLGIEIHLMVYQINSNDYLNTSTFLNMRVLNKGSHDLTNLKTSFFVDADLGYYSDDYIGCNTIKNLAFTYNGDNNDEQGFNTNGYGTSPPALGVVSLNKSLNGFGTFSSLSQNQGEPANAQQFFNYMNSLWKDGSQMVVGGSGYPGSPGSTSTTTSFLYDGDPNNLSEWSEVSSNDPVGDRRMLLTVTLADLAPGQEDKVDYAILYARKNNFDNLQNVSYLYELADSVKIYYDQNLAESACLFYDQTGLVESSKNQGLIYPNPVLDELIIGAENVLENIEISDLTGKKLINTSAKKINVSALHSGQYIVKVNGVHYQFTKY